MTWTTTIKRYRYTGIGFLIGVLIWGFGTWLEFNVEKLPFQWWALAYLHRIQPLIIAYDLAPFVLGWIGWLLDRWLGIPNQIGLLVGMMVGIAGALYLVMKRFG